MLKTAIDKILSLAEVQKLVFDGRSYTSRSITPVEDPLPISLNLSTLTGLKGLHRGQKSPRI